MQTLNLKIRKNYKSLQDGTITTQQWWDFIATVADKDLLKSVITKVQNAERRLRDYCNSLRLHIRVKKYVNHALYSDVHAYEVIRTVSAKVVEIRRLDTEAIIKPTNFKVGGFSAHCVDNDNQTYKYISNEKNTVVRLHLSKSGWGKGRYHMSDTPHEFYDYNF